MLTRRALLTSTLAATVLRPPAAIGAGAPAASATVLRLINRTIEVDGKPASVYGIRQPNGTEGIWTQIGEQFRVRVENGIGRPSLIHWHGLAPPWRQDGVPQVSGPPIGAGASAEYDFPLAYGGTFWMHSHQGLQEQLLLDAPLIVRDQRDKPDRQEVVLRLNDFSFTPPEEIFANLKQGGSMPGTAADGMAKMSAGAAMATMNVTAGTPAPPDLNDVTYDAFLANDRTLADPEVVKVERGAEILLRVITPRRCRAFTSISAGSRAG